MAAVNVTDDEFDSVIANSELPVVVDFWAEWCGPCKQMSPHLEAVSEEMADKVKVAKINVDENPMVASKYGVRGMPTLMVFKDGKVAATHLGAMSKQAIADWIKQSV
ncbi:MAG: thioredoxin [Alphaproteobacteria bacterium]|uniref:Thioredoxin n=1 Tax=Hyphomonas oceanitis SCH89 TaxID=1280953 RepID=A0A059G964_9PROT|nr:thioredoxin [Hyphomonas oceanitis]MBU1286550.1 thioredoxin [Alphaproteobacteria bacterium]KDA03013.1 thioredoxin [Hyphomonas oceanitis SCH89]MBU2083432.1 thioredoxin [Alphaproteobacteria bacterium]MBU2143603.1 thioredoxin [Alphaproteobacteria bacterium]MBU2195996.1 thioredoxin [Alphaproteobacteria bacterium]|tara:strand:+ start:325413 stop:325733 length:321 start_codon:yes stop_codon:yes gene_type:complete